MAAGYFGVLDFTGIPLWGPVLTPLQPKGNYVAAGRRAQNMARAMIFAQQIQEMRRMATRSTMHDEETAAAQAKKKVQDDLEIARRQSLLSSATYSILLAES